MVEVIIGSREPAVPGDNVGNEKKLKITNRQTN